MSSLPPVQKQPHIVLSCSVVIMLKLLLVLLLAANLSEAAVADYSDCANNLITLENISAQLRTLFKLKDFN